MSDRRRNFLAAHPVLSVQCRVWPALHWTGHSPVPLQGRQGYISSACSCDVSHDRNKIGTQYLFWPDSIPEQAVSTLAFPKLPSWSHSSVRRVRCQVPLPCHQCQCHRDCASETESRSASGNGTTKFMVKFVLNPHSSHQLSCLSSKSSETSLSSSSQK